MSTILENIKTKNFSNIISTNNISLNTTPILNKYGFIDVFSDKSITKGFHSMAHHNVDKKYNSKIPLQIIESLTVDNGQFNSWVFTDINGFVMKKSQKKLNREFIMLYLINLIREYFHNTEGIKFKKNDSLILWDINRFTTTIVENETETKRLFQESENKYLEKFKNLRFLLVYLFRGDKKSPDKKFQNVFEFNQMLNDNTLLSGTPLIQIFLNANSKVKPLICKYSRKNVLATKKYQLYTEKPVEDKKYIKNVINTESDEDSSLESQLILLNDMNLCKILENTIEPFIKLIEKSKNLIITEAVFKFIKFFPNFNQTLSKDNFYNKKENEVYKFSYCNKVMAQNKSDLNYLQYEIGMKNKLNSIKEKTIPKDLLIPKKKEVKQNLFTSVKSKEMPNKFKTYEKITKEAFCFGEFCEYAVPKFFKNLKKNSKVDEIVDNSIIPNENKFTERDKFHNLPNSLPVFLIKKAFDNPNLVNIVLKSYSIFPPGFDMDAAIRERNRIKREEEDRKKEDDKQTLIEKRSGSMIRVLPSINHIENSQILNDSAKNNQINLNNNSTMISNTDSSTTNNNSNKNETKNPNTLYYPTPNKFDHINHDFVYSRKGVCSNCFTIYTLIQTFINNIDESTSQFKSISKARDLLLQGDQLKKRNDTDDSVDEEEPEDFLFAEERNDFDLKTILKRNIKKMKREAMKKNEKRKTNIKIDKNNHNRKDDFKKDFSYQLKVNSKMLKLNLLAERTKNKFFNLIFQELRNGPDTIYQKLAIKKPDKNFNKSMTTLRMHMGINSFGYNASSKEIYGLRNKIKNEIFILEGKDSEIKENVSRISSVVLNNNNSPVKNKSDENRDSNQNLNFNVQNENTQIDVDIFMGFKNLNKNDYISPFGSLMNNILYIEDKNESEEENNISNPKEDLNESENDNSDSDSDLEEIRDEFNDDESKNKYINYDENEIDKYKKFLRSKSDLKSENKENLNLKINRASTIIEQRHTKLEIIHPKSIKSDEKIPTIEISKKISVSSIYYYDWSKDANKTETRDHYYYITTPLTKINEMNMAVTENPLIISQGMTNENFMKIGKFQQSPLLENSDIFVYDQNTAVPYKLIALKGNKKDHFDIKNLIKRKTSFKKELRRNSTLTSHILKEPKAQKYIVIVLNDFFDSFTKYQDLLTNIWSHYEDSLDKLKLLFFNFPGQSTTLFNKKAVLNNVYFTEFLDRFLFYLIDKDYFDHSYQVIFIGFGNGGQIALSYASAYEKYWEFLHSIILFNPLCENDDFINKSMLELLKIIESSKNLKLIDFFIKSITVNPQKLLDLDNKLLEMKNSEDEINLNDMNNLNQMTMTGYLNITRGYFFNLKINHKDIQTPIVLVHSNQNCFITISNTNNIFHHIKTKIFSVTKGIRNDRDYNELKSFRINDQNLTCKYDFSDIPENKIKRKFIVVDGSHDIINDNPNHISNVIHCFIKSWIYEKKINK